MTTTLREREIVIVGGGLSAGLIARRLVPLGRDVLVLERGGPRSGSESQLPSQRDELRWGIHRGLVQRENVETYTLRHTPDENALPMRRLLSFLPGFGVGGGASHWNGQTWRFQVSDYVLRSHLEDRYGKAAVPADMTIQDWGIRYDDLEPYYTLFEKLFGKPFPMPAANASRAYTNPDGMKLGACVYCGHCERFVCEASAKASPNL
jgi:gluconate 2-dehydrogenase alpha chain